MQKIIPVILIVGFGLLLTNLIWTVAISQDLSYLLEPVKESFEAKTEFARTAQELVDSEIVERFTFVAGGKIKGVEGWTLTLENGESVMEIPVATDAQVVRQTERETLPEMISFENLQVGDEVSCLVEMGKDGVWSAYRVKTMVE